MLKMRFHMFAGALLILLFFQNSDFGVSFTFVSGQSEKGLLLELRNNLTYDSSLSTKLVHWNESVSFCQWPGVKCDSTNRVSALDLSGESISSGINDATSALFKLVNLQSLSLAENSFDSTELPSGFGQLTELGFLNLSNSGFSGQVPPDFSDLTRLVVLDLSNTIYTSLKLENPNLRRLIRNFKRLRELHLDGVNISANGNEWGSAVSSSLPNLRILSLANSYLTGPFDSSLLKLKFLSVIHLDGNPLSTPFPDFFTEFPNLEVFTVSSCDLSGLVPAKLFQIKTLQRIDLSNNRDLEGSLPEFHVNGSLQNLILSYTKFSGNFSESIGNLRMLSNVDLRSCAFSGHIPRSIKNLNHLVYSDLSLNKFSGSVPSFASLNNLRVMNLRSNRLTGRIPDSIWEGLDNLNFLDLSENSLQGEIPASLFVLPLLKVLSLSNNSLSGPIRVSTYASSSSLEVLDLSINKLEGPIPQFLFQLQNLSSLSLSSNKFKGSLELTDFQKVTNLVNLDLSYNNLSVRVNEETPLSSLLPRLGTLKLASCKVQKLPLLKNQSSLMMLDLSDNRLGGEIPNWLWEVGNGFLRFLNLSHNGFTRLQEPYNLRSLQYLDLHSNKLSGQIPLPPPSAAYVDFSSNNFSSSLPHNIGNFLRPAMFFSAANNHFTGTIPASLSNASRLQILDLSNNSFSGRISEAVGELKSLYVLNFSHNALSRHIPSSIGNLQSLQSLDLSFNGLDGEIPNQLASLTFLSFLNLSYNHLVGRIPQGGQIQTFPESSFIGNAELCGLPLKKTCNNTRTSAAFPQGKLEREPEDSDREIYDHHLENGDW